MVRCAGGAGLWMLVALTALTGIPAAAEVQSSVTISGYASVLRSGDQPALAALAKSPQYLRHLKMLNCLYCLPICRKQIENNVWNLLLEL